VPHDYNAAGFCDRVIIPLLIGAVLCSIDTVFAAAIVRLSAGEKFDRACAFR
jgi:hypothetical protein